MSTENLDKNKDQGEAVKSFINSYINKWYWFALGLLIAVGAGNFYLRYTPKRYESEAKISIIKKDESMSLDPKLLRGPRVNLEKEIELLKSYPIVEQVVKNQDLTVSFFIEGNVQTTEVNSLPIEFTKTIKNSEVKYASYRISVTDQGFDIFVGNSEKPKVSSGFTTLGVEHNLPFELNINNSPISRDLYGEVFIVRFAPLVNVTKSLKNAIDIQRLGKATDLLTLRYTSQSTAKNERIINELIKVFNDDGVDDRRQVSLTTIKFIDARFESLSEELDSVETDIKEFKQDNKIVDIETGGAAGISELRQVQEQLFTLENQLMLLSILEDSIKESSSNPELLPTNIGLSNGDVNRLVYEYNRLVLDLQKYETSAGENNPQVVIQKEKLKELKDNIIASLANLKVQLSATKSQTEEKNKQAAAEVFSMPAKEKMFLEIKRQQEIKQELYVYLLEIREQAAINYAITEPTVKVVESALSSGYPVSPNKNSIYFNAILAGLGIPFGLIYLFTLLDTKLKSRVDIEKVTKKIPIAGELPKFRKKEQIVFQDRDDNTNYAEAFRIMTHNLNYMLPPEKTDKGYVMYVTSTIKGEGKTYVSINLSLALSSINKKVLLIGGDLRNPQIHNYIDRDKDIDGLSRYLYDAEFNWRDGLIKGFDEHPEHDILLSGSIPPNPSSLLTNGRFKLLLDEAKEEYDFIIVDTAPTILVSDTMLISTLADVIVYVTRANFTEKKLLQFSRDLSESGKLNNMVYVINALDRRSTGYGYRYGYNYGYGYGYGSKTKSK